MGVVGLFRSSALGAIPFFISRISAVKSKAPNTNENQELNGYVMDLQKFDALLKAAEKEGSIIVEETVLNGITDKTFEL